MTLNSILFPCCENKVAGRCSGGLQQLSANEIPSHLSVLTNSVQCINIKLLFWCLVFDAPSQAPSVLNHSLRWCLRSRRQPRRCSNQTVTKIIWFPGKEAEKGAKAAGTSLFHPPPFALSASNRLCGCGSFRRWGVRRTERFGLTGCQLGADLTASHPETTIFTSRESTFHKSRIAATSMKGQATRDERDPATPNRFLTAIKTFKLD